MPQVYFLTLLKISYFYFCERVTGTDGWIQVTFRLTPWSLFPHP